VKSLSPELSIRLQRPVTGVRVVDASVAEMRSRWDGEDVESAFARGVAQGEARALAATAGALDRAVATLEAARSRAEQDLSHAAVELAIEIARTLVRAEIDAGRYDIERIVRESLAASGVGRRACVVHLNPIDAERLKSVPFRSATVIEPDLEVARGDVHVTTPHGILVRDVDSALDSIAERIRGDLK
jgi:flagellar biosynthesis/type III secretory pathway protein FliH